MKEMKRVISFGSPKDFNEAIFRLPHKDNMTPNQREDEEMVGLSEVRERIENILSLLGHGNDPSILYRTINVTFEELKLMEEWSFKRSKIDSVFLTWDDNVAYHRGKMFEGIISPPEIMQNVDIWKIEPNLDGDLKDYVFICFMLGATETYYDDAQISLSILDKVEYDILIGRGHY